MPILSVAQLSPRVSQELMEAGDQEHIDWVDRLRFRWLWEFEDRALQGFRRNDITRTVIRNSTCGS